MRAETIGSFRTARSFDLDAAVLQSVAFRRPRRPRFGWGPEFPRIGAFPSRAMAVRTSAAERERVLVPGSAVAVNTAESIR